MNAKTQKRRTYWLADIVTPELRERGLLLNQKGYDVQFFSSLETLTAELLMRRAGVIVVSDDFDDKVTERILLKFMSLPEVQGARMVMVRSKVGEAVNVLASCANFRDIIPADLDTRSFLTRFIYATAGKPMPFEQPNGQVSMNDIAALSLPARVTWLSSKHLRFECRIRPAVGATMKLKGPLAAAAGVPYLSLVIVETQRSHMVYRFSDAAIAAWHVPTQHEAKMAAVLDDLARLDPGPRCRIFIAVHTPALRAQVQISFEQPQFEVATALQKQSIVEEPKFFTPDVVVIEDLLCLQDGGERFDAMMATLQEQTTVVILGKMPDFIKVRQAWPLLRVIQFSRMPPTLAQQVLTRYMPLRQTIKEPSDKSGTNIASEHRFSLAEIGFPVRLQRLHPQAAQVALPFSIGNFALCRLDSPLLRKIIGRHPYLKLTTTYQDSHPDAQPFVHLVEGYLADLHPGEQQALGDGLLAMVTKSLTKSDQAAGFVSPRVSGGEARVGQALSAPSQLPPPPPVRDDAAALSLALSEAPIDPSDLLQTTLAQQASPLVAVPEPPPVVIPAPDVPMPRPLPLSAIKRIKRRKEESRFERSLAIKAVIIIAVAGSAVIGGFSLLAGHVSKSGGNYSNQLEKFAQPKLNANKVPPVGSAASSGAE